MYALGCSTCSAHSSLGCCTFSSRTVNPIVYKLHASLPYRIRCDNNFLCIILADWLFQKFILQSLVYKDVGHSRISTVEPLIVDTPNSGHLCLTDSRSTPCIFTLLTDSVDSLVKKKQELEAKYSVTSVLELPLVTAMHACASLARS